MRFVSPILSFACEPQPEARVGAFYPVGAKDAVEALAIPYPFRRGAPQRPLEAEAEPPLLFEAVAGLTDGPAVLDFAVRWGLLSPKTEFLALAPLKRGEQETVQWVGHRVERYLAIGAEMREVLEIWRACCASDEEALKRLGAELRAPRGPRLPRKSKVPFYASKRLGGFELEVPLPPQSSLTDAGWRVLEKLLNDRLRGDPDPMKDVPLQVRYDAARATRPLSLILRPRSLLAAAWAQLTEHVSRDEARACPRCGRIFIVYLEVSGRRQEYCSNACRIAMHRRQKAARRKA